jgi:hypothetical protein
LNVEVVGPPAVMKEKHLRVMLRQNGRTLVLKAWNFAERVAELEPGRARGCGLLVGGRFLRRRAGTAGVGRRAPGCAAGWLNVNYPDR